MSVAATIEQEFQEIDAANEWQPRYLVSQSEEMAGCGEYKMGGKGLELADRRVPLVNVREEEVARPRFDFRCAHSDGGGGGEDCACSNLTRGR